MIYFKYHDILFENKASCFQYSMEFVNLSNYDFSIILLVWQPVSTGLCLMRLSMRSNQHKIVYKKHQFKNVFRSTFLTAIHDYRNSTNFIHRIDNFAWYISWFVLMSSQLSNEIILQKSVNGISFNQKYHFYNIISTNLINK